MLRSYHYYVKYIIPRNGLKKRTRAGVFIFVDKPGDRRLCATALHSPYLGVNFRQSCPTILRGMIVAKLTVNGKAVTINASPDTPLLWALRDDLKMNGTKFGCGMALCGACTVHIDGEPARSCSIPLSAVEGKKITTIEGIASKGLHPVQQAWIELDVPQCGYCQSGQIMSAVALLTKNKNPSDADIDAAMSGNICRCGTYQRMRAAIHKAAGRMSGKKEA